MAFLLNDSGYGKSGEYCDKTVFAPRVSNSCGAWCGTLAGNGREPYFGGGGGEKISRLRPGSGFGFGLGAFLTSFLPLSLFPMQESMTHKSPSEKPHGASTRRGLHS
jgi:hypothetical protein